jgi:hypothetical protein
MGMFDKLFGEKSSVDRYVGGDASSQKDLRTKMEKIFRDQALPALKGIEMPKTPEMLEMIELVNRETDLLREKYGLPGYEIPARNYHVISRKQAEELHLERGGLFTLPGQKIVMTEEENWSVMLRLFFHETVHFKSFSSVDVPDKKERRLGLRTAVAGEDRPMFNPLNEAITEELTKLFMRKQEEALGKSPELEGFQRVLAVEMDMLQEERGNLAGEMDDAVAVEYVESDGEGTDMEIIKFGYSTEREALDLLIEKLQKGNPTKARSREEWFDMFASAMFNGHLLELARNIEKTFGEGAFRKLGEQQTATEFMWFVESL